MHAWWTIIINVTILNDALDNQGCQGKVNWNEIPENVKNLRKDTQSFHSREHTICVVDDNPILHRSCIYEKIQKFLMWHVHDIGNLVGDQSYWEVVPPPPKKKEKEKPPSPLTITDKTIHNCLVQVYSDYLTKELNNMSQNDKYLDP